MPAQNHSMSTWNRVGIIGALVGTFFLFPTIPTGNHSIDFANPSSWIDVGAYRDKIVVVPAPRAAPVLTAVDFLASTGTFVPGDTYEVTYSYVGYTGESGLSPATTFIATPGQGIAVLPIAKKGVRAVGSRVYIRDVTTGVGPLQGDIFPGVRVTDLVQFGDDGALGGATCAFLNDGSHPPHPRTDNATEADGLTHIDAPTIAPTVKMIAALPPWTTFYGAYSYVGQDGTETALSPISAPVTTTGNNGRWIWFRIPNEPPSGAVFVNVYLGTTNTFGGMHLQASKQPLHYVVHEIHSYNSSGASNVPAAPRSTISAFQQAWDDVLEAGGGAILVPPGPYTTRVPIILRGRNAGGALPVGLRVFGTAGHDVNGSSSKSRIDYVGSQTGVELVVSMAQSTTIEDLDFADPNSRARYGLALADFTGGESFTQEWNNVSFMALAPNGVGLIVSLQSRAVTGHTASDQLFKNATIGGGAWGVELHGSQTGNFDFQDCFIGGGGRTSGANSGELRIFGTWVSTSGRLNTLGYGHYGFLMTAEEAHPFHGGGNSLTIENLYTENQTTTFEFVTSSLATNSNYLSVKSSAVSNYTGHAVYSLFANAPTYASFDGQTNYGIAGDVYLKHPNALLTLTNGSQSSVITYKMKAESPAYNRPATTYIVAPIQFLNESKQASTVGTDGAGDITLNPFASVSIGNGIKPDGSGFKHLRVASCVTDATAGATCDTVVPWPSAFRDDRYSVACSITGTRGQPRLISVPTQTPSALTVRIEATKAVASSGTIQCMAVHD